jgi:type I restriction enzyme S subunit
VMDSLPSGWAAATLSDITNINPRTFTSKPLDDDIVSFVPMAAVEAESGRLDASRGRPWKEVNKGFTAFEENDVLFAKITPCMENGKFVVARGLIGGRGAGSTEFHVLRPSSGIRPELLFYCLLQSDLRRAARMKMKGAAGQLRVPPEFLAELPFNVPPSREQNRIVDQIEELFSDLDAAIAALKRVQANLKRYRASVLKAACEGRLVPTEAELARQAGGTYESGEQLLARILKERRAKWEADQFAKMLAAGKPPKNDDWKKKYKEPDLPDSSDLPEVAEGWTWASMDQLICSGPQNGLYKPAASYSGGTEIIRIDDYQLNYLRERVALRSVAVTPEELATYSIVAGDLILNRVNSPSHLGKTIVVPESHVGVLFESNMMRFRVSDFVLPSWITTVLQTSEGRVRLTANAKWAVNQASINQHDVAQTAVPLPPVSEQQRIVAFVESQISIVTHIEMSSASLTARAGRLRQAILKRAFEGKLVPQDPSDEPASALLKRIRAERAAKTAPEKNYNLKRKAGVVAVSGVSE